MPSVTFSLQSTEMTLRPVGQCVAIAACRLMKDANLGGRFELGPETYCLLELEMISGRNPSFRMAGNAHEGTWHMEWVVAGAPIEVWPNAQLEEGIIKAETRT